MSAGLAKTQCERILAANQNIVDLGYDQLGVSKEVFAQVAEDLSKAFSCLLAGNTAADQNATMLQVATALINEMIGAHGKVLLYRSRLDAATVNTAIWIGS